MTLSRGDAFSLKNIQNRITGPHTRERSKKNDLSGLIAPDFIDAVAQHIQYLSDWSSLGNVVSDGVVRIEKSASGGSMLDLQKTGIITRVLDDQFMSESIRLLFYEIQLSQ